MLLSPSESLSEDSITTIFDMLKSDVGFKDLFEPLAATPSPSSANAGETGVEMVALGHDQRGNVIDVPKLTTATLQAITSARVYRYFISLLSLVRVKLTDLDVRGRREWTEEERR